MTQTTTPQSEVLFLLGAGASKDAGLPLATELTELITGDIEANFPELLPLMRFIHGGICFGRGCEGRRPQDPVNIEEFLMACHDLAHRNRSRIYPFVASWHERLDAIEVIPKAYRSAYEGVGNAFEFVIEHSKRRLKEWLTPSDMTRAKYFRNFVDFIRNGHKLHIFTLNYDNCVEHALNEVVGTIDREWTNGFDAKGWSPDKLKSKKFKAFLYKLHGSLDWVDDEELGLCSVRWPEAARAAEIPENYESLLIFGTAMKVIPSDPYLTLLVRFRETLFRCHCVVSVGYSFGDEHINTIILDVLRLRPDLHCIIANRTKDANDLSFLPEGFRQQIARDRFHTVPGIGAREAFESNKLLEIANEIHDLKEESPF
jgi:hypothetical protein